MSTNCINCVVNDRTGTDLLCNECRDVANERKRVRRAAFLTGFIAGLTEYAWWKDGVQYVGTCGTTLQQAIDRAKEESGKVV